MHRGLSKLRGCNPALGLVQCAMWLLLAKAFGKGQAPSGSSPQSTKLLPKLLLACTDALQWGRRDPVQGEKTKTPPGREVRAWMEIQRRVQGMHIGFACLGWSVYGSEKQALMQPIACLMELNRAAAGLLPVLPPQPPLLKTAPVPNRSFHHLDPRTPPPLPLFPPLGPLPPPIPLQD